VRDGEAATGAVRVSFFTCAAFDAPRLRATAGVEDAAGVTVAASTFFELVTETNAVAGVTAASIAVAEVDFFALVCAGTSFAVVAELDFFALVYAGTSCAGGNDVFRFPSAALAIAPGVVVDRAAVGVATVSDVAGRGFLPEVSRASSAVGRGRF